MGNKKTISSGFIQSILNRRLVSVHIVAAIIATVAICILTNGEPVNEVIRNIIFATGGIGALYGLIIASRRQDDFKKQTQLQHDQRFSEKLSTCLETIAKEDPLSQTAGFLLLKELYEAAVDNQLNLIDDIMKQYIISKTDIIFRKIEDSQWTKHKDPNDRLKSLLIAQAFKYFIEKSKITGEPDDLSDEDMKNKHTLEKIKRLQEQLDTLIFEKGRTPEFLMVINDNQIKDHPVLKVNPARAYEWVNDKGNKYRRLVQSGIIIDKQDHNKKDNKEHDDQVSEKDSETFLDWMASIWPWK